MIRLFVLLGIVGGAAITYLATYGVGPEGQLSPAVSQLVKFEAAGLAPAANALTENENVEHGVFEVPAEDEAMLEMALANAPAMDMGASGTMDTQSGTTMGTTGTESGTMDMGTTATGTMDMNNGDMAMAEGGLLITDDGDFDREIELTMAEWKFSEMKIDVKMGERIRFTVKNGGNIPHEFMFMTVPAMSAITYRANRADWSLLEHEALLEKPLLLPGGEFSFVMQVQQAGSWMFMCMLPYHMQMGMMGQMATPGMAMDM